MAWKLVGANGTEIIPDFQLISLDGQITICYVRGSRHYSYAKLRIMGIILGGNGATQQNGNSNFSSSPFKNGINDYVFTIM
ncbi:MAG: hypothetical protein IPP53_10570 [Bacteroidetes bacterium]|nr:hypothetical protein [Bacteroidota bacterium]